MSFQKKITVTADNTGSPFALGSYQDYIDLTSSWASDIFANARADGADIAVYDSAGTTLQNFWLEYYNNSNSTGRLWVKVNSLAIGSTLQYQIRYKDPSRSVSLGSFDNTFQKFQAADIGSGNVLAVFQYDDGSGSTPVDATGTYSASSTVSGGVPTWLGHAGGCWPGFNGSAAQNGTHFASGSAIHFNGSEAHLITGLCDTWPAAGEIGCWFCPDSTINNTTTGFPHLWCKINAGTTSYWSAALACYFNTDGTLSVDQYYGSGSIQSLHSQTTSWAAGVWHFVQVRWNLATIELWVDGVLEAVARTNQGSGNGQTGSGAGNPFAFGSFYQANAGIQYNLGITQSFTGYLYGAYVLKTQPNYDYDGAILNWRKYQQGMEPASRLSKYGTVLSPSNTGGTYDQYLKLESTPVVTGSKIRLSATGGTYNPSLSQALALFEATDGKTFSTPAGVTNPITIWSGYKGSCLLLNPDDSLWYWFGTNSTASGIYYSTSTDGTTWPSAPTAITALSVSGIGQAWCNTQVYNPWFFKDTNDSKWKCSLQGWNGTIWQTGLFVSSTGLTSGGSWAAIGTNPKTSLQYKSGSASAQWIMPRPGVSNLYDAIAHISTSGFGPNYGRHYTSTDLNTWTGDRTFLLGLGNESFAAGTGHDSKGGPADQTADFRLVEFGGVVYLYYDVDRNDASWNGQQARVDLATYGSTLASLWTVYPVKSFSAPSNITSVQQMLTLLGVGA